MLSIQLEMDFWYQNNVDVTTSKSRCHSDYPAISPQNPHHPDTILSGLALNICSVNKLN